MVEDYKIWIERAKSSLKIAQIEKNSDIYYEDLCFQAQQAVEKALKALLIKKEHEPQKTHNLIVILQEVMNYYKVPEELKNIIILNDYAVQTRYPGDYTPIEKEEYLKAIAIAVKAVSWAEKAIEIK